MKYRVGMIIKGKVTGIQPYGAFVELDNQTQGLIHISEVRNGYVDDIHNFLHVGDSVKVMVMDIDEYTNKISLSLRCLEKPFNFEYDKEIITHQHKEYWTNKKSNIGFKSIDNLKKRWIEESLENIAKKKSKNS